MDDLVDVHVVVSTSGFRVTHYKHKVPRTDITVVCFGIIGSGLSDKGFGVEFCLKAGYDAIFVAQAKGSQYQGLSLQDFQAHVAPLLAGRRAVTYGSSLGAYCALYYGGCIDATIIAASPKNSAHPCIRKASFKGPDFQHDDLVQVPRTTRPVVVLYDPFVPSDRRFLKTQIRPAYPEARYVKLPHGGHPVLLYLREMGSLSGFIKDFIETGQVRDPGQVTHDSAVWNRWRGIHLREKGQLPAAERHLLKSIEIEPHERAVNALLDMYLKTGRDADIRKLLLRIAGHRPKIEIRKSIRARLRARGLRRPAPQTALYAARNRIRHRLGTLGRIFRRSRGALRRLVPH